MIRRTRSRAVSRRHRRMVLARLAADIGQTAEQVTEYIRQAIEQGWLIETPGGWQAAVAGESGPVT